MMKGLVALACSLLALGQVCYKSTPKAPVRPLLVPNTAVWAGGIDGGSFFECDVDARHNVNRCLVYNDYTGGVSGGGFFHLAGLNRAARKDELQYRFFDGDRIELASGTLVPVEPIRPTGVPKDAVFTNGLFIYCDSLSGGKTSCGIYRPDGGEYFKGSFIPDAELGGTIQDGYKFFDLSDRTIHLVGGGALVAR